MTEVPFAKHDNMINALPSDRTDQPFRISVLPRRSGRGRSISDAHGANTPKQHLAIRSVAVMDKIARSLVPSAGLDQLPGDPFRGRMCRGAQPQNPTPVMPQDEQAVQKPEPDCWHYEQVDRGDAVRMVAQKRPPALRRWASPPCHVFGHA